MLEATFLDHTLVRFEHQRETADAEDPIVFSLRNPNDAEQMMWDGKSLPEMPKMALARCLEVLHGRNRTECFNTMSKIVMITTLDPTNIAPVPAVPKGGGGGGKGKAPGGKGRVGGRKGGGRGRACILSGGKRWVQRRQRQRRACWWLSIFCSVQRRGEGGERVAECLRFAEEMLRYAEAGDIVGDMAGDCNIVAP